MKRFFPQFGKTEGELIASWDDAKLIKALDGKYELVGGTKQGLTAAREWISLFMPDAVIRERSGRGR